MKFFHAIAFTSCLLVILIGGCSSQTPTATQTELPATPVQKQQIEAEKICEEIQRFAKDQKPSFYVAGTALDNPNRIDWFVFSNESDRAKAAGEPLIYASVWMRGEKPTYVTWAEGMTSGVTGNSRYTEYFFRSNGVLAAIYTQGDLRVGEGKRSHKFFFDNNAKPITTEAPYNEYSAPTVYERVEDLPFYALLPE